MGEPEAVQAEAAAEKARAIGSTVPASTGSAGPRNTERERLRRVGSRSSREGARSRKFRGAETGGSSRVLRSAFAASPVRLSAEATTNTWPRASKGETWAVLSISRVASTEVEVFKSRVSTWKSGWNG